MNKLFNNLFIRIQIFQNCDDWDENMQSTNKMNSAQDGNNQQDKRKGY